jgi:hypothetical protein
MGTTLLLRQDIDTSLEVWVPRQQRLSLNRLAYAKIEDGVTAISGIKLHAVSPV